MNAMSPVQVRRRVPLPPLIALSAFALVGVVAMIPTHNSTPARVQAERRLRFDDAANDLIIVRDADSGRTIATIPVADQGFARGLVHALEVMRHRYRAPLDGPYILERLDDGRLVLNDPSAPMHIDIESFGPTNEAVFAGYLGEGARK
ncbi:photosynthetic complex assembly protein PuhC [Lichenicola sp.]|uniref:photosynthetic complex assembly protein PuhC n=1 Tax=Lichenicola sp. TaxID=2804529 RepID=UPI003AFFC2FF